MDDVLRHTESGIGRPRLDVKITGGVIVYSEPASHPETVSVSPLGIVVGVHPKHFQSLPRTRSNLPVLVLYSSYVPCMFRAQLKIGLLPYMFT